MKKENPKLSNEILQKLLKAQRSELTEHYIYKKLAEKIKDSHNKSVLNHISEDELKHHNIWKVHTKKQVKPYFFKFWKYYLISKIFGMTFGLKLMEKGEENAQENYKEISKHIKGHAEKIQKDEEVHEKQILNLLDEEKLKYVGSIVLGLNDALVELTGALAGLTLALQNSKLIATAGLVTGIAASFSMAASEYLSTKSDERENNASGKNQEKTKTKKHPVKASVYTGFAYILTVLFLIFPYLILNNLYFSLIWTLINAVLVILIFTYYISVAQDINFKKEFFSMALISLGVAVISFGFGYLIRIGFGVEV